MVYGVAVAVVAVVMSGREGSRSSSSCSRTGCVRFMYACRSDETACPGVHICICILVSDGLVDVVEVVVLAVAVKLVFTLRQFPRRSAP